MSEVKKERNYGIDLLRAAAMLMVCLLHVLGQGGVLSASEKGGAQYVSAWLIEIAAFCAVNCYALVSGYVGVGAKWKISRLLYIWLQAALYSVLITVGFKIAGAGEIGVKEILLSAVPVFTREYWYLTAYFGLFFLMPFLNAALNTMEKKSLIASVSAVLGIFSVYSIVRGDPFFLHSGYSVLWLAVLYLAGGCIKKYDLFAKVKSKWLILAAAGAVIFTWAVKMSIRWAYVYHPMKLLEYAFKGANHMIDYLSPVIILVAVCLLVLFSRMPFRKKPKIVPLLASTSFGVYLIHEQPLIRERLLRGALVSIASYNPVLMVLAVFGVTVLIYLACSLIDGLRLGLFSALHVKQLLKKADERIERKIH